MDAWWIVVLGAMAAGLVQGIAGFGFGMVAMSFWVWILEPQAAAALAVLGAVQGQLIAAVTVRRGFNACALAPFILGGLLGLPLGIYLLPQLDMQWFKLLLGMFLVVVCPLMMFSALLPRIAYRPRWADALVGLFGGVMGGLGGMTGVLPSLWCTLTGMEKDAQRAVLQNFNLSLLLVTTASYIATGLVTAEVWLTYAMVAPAILIPSLMGGKLYKGLSERRFKQCVLGLLTASGITMLIAAVWPLLVH
ncbi:sulfite exporter TauE/SafE family protein [Lampropedia aestuarii]|uniref:sulfite exporter TauE/SafE family protein n=1 Tax=Lampropedia aestuarii TaxID=2562762 RepID=UPI0024693B8D|nr:sulfite exporter TauE/SafE family protein [Lampropedia aestuarii]MDH5858658.1 sulfite exporter TauE/SafE family protein [Lampropedia aestuarii]